MGWSLSENEFGLPPSLLPCWAPGPEFIKGVLFPAGKATCGVTWGERGAAVPAAEGLRGARDVGDAVHGGGGGAGGGGHEDGQVWHLRQVDDSWREKQEDCQDTTELLEWGVVLGSADASRCSGAEQEMPAHMEPPGAGCQGRGPSCGQIQPVLLLEITGRKMPRLSLWSQGAAGSDS